MIAIKLHNVLTDIFYLRVCVCVCVLSERALSKRIRVSKSRLREGLFVKSVVSCKVYQNLPNICNGYSTNIMPKQYKDGVRFTEEIDMFFDKKESCVSDGGVTFRHSVCVRYLPTFIYVFI
jgi:hypothetical protein